MYQNLKAKQIFASVKPYADMQYAYLTVKA